MLAFDFMRRALLVGMLLAVLLPGVGMVVVLRRLSLMGDALSHASLAGVALGLLMGFHPVLGAVFACVTAAFLIEVIRKKMPQHGELALAVVLSAGVGLAGVLSGLGNSPANFNSFLFGSIVAIGDRELIFILAVGLLTLTAFLLLYRELLAISFDERAARLSGVPVGIVQPLFTLLTALAIALAARTVGALVVSSLMVLPVACAMQLGKGFRSTLLAAAGLGLLFTLAGLTLSFYGRLRPGGAIVLVGVAGLGVLFAGRAVGGRLIRRLRRTLELLLSPRRKKEAKKDFFVRE